MTEQLKPFPQEKKYSIFSSERINSFLDTIQAGQKYAFFDMDQNFWKKGVDVEEIAFKKYGLIDQNRKPAWEEEIAKVEKQNGDYYMVGLRHLNLTYYPQTITPELSQHTGFEEGTPLHSKIVYELGKTIGKEVIANNLYREIAVKVFKECEKQGIKIVFISATPVDLAQGVLDHVTQELGLAQPTAVIGTEDTYHADGTVTESLFVYGNTKTAVVQEAKKKGAIAWIGSGDKPTASDSFMHECKIKGHTINSAPDEGEAGWEHVLKRLQETRGNKIKPIQSHTESI